MDCFHPFYRPRDAGSGSPFSNQMLPCGRCGACRVNRATEWSYRMLWESSYWECTSFWTLTYEDSRLPVDLSVSKRELQLFFKRLRKDLHPSPLKYFACGEYGEDRGRPHYHAVIFGVDFMDTEVVQCAWPFGFVYGKPFLIERARYTAGYLLKEVNEDISLVGRVRPFALMSQGLGKRYAQDTSGRFEDGLTVHGEKVPVPRYFKRVTGFVSRVHSNGESDLALRHMLRTDVGVSRDGWRRMLDAKASIVRSRSQAEKDFFKRKFLRKQGIDYGL